MELPLKLVDTPQPKKLFGTFARRVKDHRDQTVASVTTVEGLYRAILPLASECRTALKKLISHTATTALPISIQ